MDYLFVIAVCALIAIVVLTWAWIHWVRTRRTERDDLTRAGDPGDELTPYEASRRAEGKAAWTRITGM